MIKLVLTSTLLITLLACSSSPIKKEDKIDLSSYEYDVKQACLKSGKYAKHSQEDQSTLCGNHAERSMASSEKLFWLYQEKNVLKKCDKLIGKEFSTCAIAYQKKFYDVTTKDLIKKIYVK